MKTDPRVLALFPKAEVPNVPATPAATVPPPPPAPPVLLDAAIVEQRITAERAAALAEGKASRQAEVDALATERDSLKTSLAQAQGTVTQLTATVAAEKSARIAAEKAHAVLMGGVKFVPDEPKTALQWNDLVKQHGYASARKLFPDVWLAYMQSVPGWKQRKQE
jgi:hypothetical protein